MGIRTLKATDLHIDKPIAWHIYAGDGRLLLKKGMSLRSNRQVAKLISLAAFRKLDGKDEEEIVIDEDMVGSALSPFEQIDKVLDHLERIFKVIIYKPANPKRKIAEKINELSEGIIKLCEYDIDATIGTIHIGNKYDYTIIHPLHCAVLCYCLASKIGLKDRRLNTIISAALTSNLGMFELQSQLLSQRGPLTPAQRDEVNKHTMRSVVFLKRIGVYDKLWLEIVLQHHEKIDGTGYPRKLGKKKFIIEAKILGIADRYHAMVAPRDYREGMSPTDALKLIFQERGAEVDAKLGALLIKEMGIYPPGAIVQLANREIAIVTRRGEDRMKPIVKSIISAEGNRYLEPIAHDSSVKMYKILGLCNLPESQELDLYSLWDYNLK